MLHRIKFQYRALRECGWRAGEAMRAARILVSWHRREAGEFDHPDAIHCVRLRAVPDETATFDDVCGDTYNPRANPDIPRSRLEREEAAFRDLVEREGVWGVVSEYWDETDERWRHADSCFGFAGYKDVMDPRENPYIPDLMSAALEARTESVRNWRAVCKAAP